MNMARVWRAAALFFAILALVFGGLFLRFRWADPRSTFDVLGVLWLLENVGPIGTLVLFIISALGSLYFTIRYFLTR